MEGDNEREGEDEIVLNPQVSSATPTDDAAAEAADAEAASSILDTFTPVLSESKEAEEDRAVEQVAEEIAEETEADRELAAAANKERAKYLQRVANFYKERKAYHSGKRNTTKPQRKEFWEIFKKGQSDSKLATIEKDGTLVLKNKNGEIVDTIAPHTYETPDADYHEAIEKKRLKEIKKTEKDYEDAMTVLRNTDRSDRGEYKEAMRLVEVADLRLQQARFPYKHVFVAWPTLMKNLVFDRSESKRSAYCFVGEPMTLQQRYAIEVDGVTALKANAEERKTRIQDVDIILVGFAEGPHKYLSSWYMRKMDYRKRTYICAYQAIMAEMARKFDDYARVERILGASDPQDMTITWDQVEGATEKKWKEKLEKLIRKVNRAKFMGSKKMSEALLATGEKHIGYIPPENVKDHFQGIGYGLDEDKAYKRSSWRKHGNRYGKALERIRDELTASSSTSRTKEEEEEEEEEEDEEEEEEEVDAEEEEEAEEDDEDKAIDEEEQASNAEKEEEEVSTNIEDEDLDEED